MLYMNIVYESMTKHVKPCPFPFFSAILGLKLRVHSPVVNCMLFGAGGHRFNPLAYLV